MGKGLVELSELANNLILNAAIGFLHVCNKIVIPQVKHEFMSSSVLHVSLGMNLCACRCTNVCLI